MVVGAAQLRAAHNPWTESSVDEMKYRFVRDVRLYFLSPREWKLWRLATRSKPPVEDRSPIDRFVGRHTTRVPGVVGAAKSNHSVLISCSARTRSSIRLVPHFDFPEVQSLIDSIDIVTASQSMWSERLCVRPSECRSRRRTSRPRSSRPISYAGHRRRSRGASSGCTTAIQMSSRSAPARPRSSGVALSARRCTTCRWRWT